MTSAYGDLLSFYVNELMNGHVFQSANEHKGIGLDQPVLAQYPISVSKCVSNPYLGK